jgi:hypothetical protein
MTSRPLLPGATMLLKAKLDLTQTKTFHATVRKIRPLVADGSWYLVRIEIAHQTTDEAQADELLRLLAPSPLPAGPCALAAKHLR